MYLNGKTAAEVCSPFVTVTSVELTPGQVSDLHTISVQAVGAGGLNSSLTHVTFSVQQSEAAQPIDKLRNRTSEKKRLVSLNCLQNCINLTVWSYHPRCSTAINTSIARSSGNSILCVREVAINMICSWLLLEVV